ncbi:hypothetical protein AKJ64_01875 [candidate division MSBL1 archaeon SCGC-AAA259E17]|uniref:Uncharacterized protein n=1 Tax=candidate division MSBL1 archaeon SCGC-AAA259E17 TaxID=1698263 RepID=A0A133UFD3_9EURY|nr:hypothetical protein AKJ64_01875 [candidate division MSBL1 archaeon SCGC-AAA259E17]
MQYSVNLQSRKKETASLVWFTGKSRPGSVHSSPVRARGKKVKREKSRSREGIRRRGQVT